MAVLKILVHQVLCILPGNIGLNILSIIILFIIVVDFQ